MPYIGGRLAFWKAETLFDGSLANFLYKPEIGLLHKRMSELRVQYNFNGKLDI